MGDVTASRRLSWTFLTNHARVLVQIARDPTLRVRDIAARCELTERAVQRIIADLETDGYLTHTRVGRSNHYQVAPDTQLRHPADAGATVADLLDAALARRPNGEHGPESVGT
ncbi:helix-turn-helix domain-containing protein [Kitasatospora sp. MBT63]|uniref:helix-turn-helix transcriptional regulator n=1 Tax=Kitasatospora sp. MBT63 TaxID=1444768 RepID=UPI000539CECB|nr:helix-turn-helix domain-containing protein [Kitasatospora sp. MBT63]